MSKIFMTGLTGLVGSSFLTALLKDCPDTQFVCLVRGGKNRTAEERAREAVRSQCDFDGESSRFDEVMKHVTVVDGDVVTMDSAAVASNPLVAGTEEIFHCAADVNLGKDPTGKTFRINYNGTVHMLELAKLLKVKAFHYVSTAYVAGRKKGVALEAEAENSGFNNPYEESKFKAEKLVRESGLPFTIYRPAIITGRRSDGRIRRPLAFYRIIEFLAKMKSHRCKKMNIDPVSKMDLKIHFKVIPSERVYFVPIDYVQYAIAKCYQLPVADQTYHVTGDSPVSTMMIDKAVCKTLNLAQVDISGGENRDGDDDKLMERFLGDLFPYFSANIEFSQTNIRKALGDAALNWKYAEHELEVMMRNYFADFYPDVEWLQNVIGNR